ncbi:hypothetical protein EDM00_06255 [Ornithobacterium rhinotracheale]|uniref:hypothetical protein n=1 Tax=Ornithobacterium rhinotracheale TaxID=28251 RepID=UPI00129CA0C5|nr:hypothetical protein [Ornithobacterium rhinotracheale]MRI63591.1 hypothetical protein [Ornithobacterium rhinotracheale]
MKLRIINILLASSMLVACKNTAETITNLSPSESEVVKDSTATDSISGVPDDDSNTESMDEDLIDPEAGKIKDLDAYVAKLLSAPGVEPIKGYRFSIEGDFDGDGQKEKLTEHYFSGKTNKETNKFYKGLKYYDFITVVVNKKPYCFMTSSNPAMQSLPVSDNKQQAGLMYVKNEGDLDGDGGDEVSFVVNYADSTSNNEWVIMTYKNKQWKRLYSFEIREFDIPELPGTESSYSMFGQVDMKPISQDSLFALQEKEMRKYKGRVTKIKDHVIRLEGVLKLADECDVTVDLRKLKK